MMEIQPCVDEMRQERYAICQMSYALCRIPWFPNVVVLRTHLKFIHLIPEAEYTQQSFGIYQLSMQFFSPI